MSDKLQFVGHFSYSLLISSLQVSFPTARRITLKQSSSRLCPPRGRRLAPVRLVRWFWPDGFGIRWRARAVDPDCSHKPSARSPEWRRLVRRAARALWRSIGSRPRPAFRCRRPGHPVPIRLTRGSLRGPIPRFASPPRIAPTCPSPLHPFPTPHTPPELEGRRRPRVARRRGRIGCSGEKLRARPVEC